MCFTHSRYGLGACGGSGRRASTGSAKSLRLLPNQMVPRHQLFTAGVDGTARMWRLGEPDGSAVIFSHTKQSVGDISLSTASTTGNSSTSTKAFTSSSKHIAGIRSSGALFLLFIHYQVDFFPILKQLVLCVQGRCLEM